MRVRDLQLHEFSGYLAREGLSLRVGPVTIHLDVPVTDGHSALYELYGSHPVSPGTADAFIDAFVGCRPSIDPRRPLRKRVHFYIDGAFHATARDPQLSVPSLEWTMNWAVATRLHQFVVLHSAIVARDGRALILPGRPGSGKSTLCAALASRGWRLLSDEMTLIRPADGWAVPCPRPVSLKEASIEAMRRFAPAAVLKREFPGTSKGTVGYLVPPRASVEAQDRTALPAWVVFPKWREGAEPRMEALSEVETFTMLNINAVNYEVMGEIGPRVLASLVHRCPGYRFEYGSLDAAAAGIEQLTA